MIKESCILKIEFMLQLLLFYTVDAVLTAFACLGQVQIRQCAASDESSSSIWAMTQWTHTNTRSWSQPLQICSTCQGMCNECDIRV